MQRGYFCSSLPATKDKATINCWKGHHPILYCACSLQSKRAYKHYQNFSLWKMSPRLHRGAGKLLKLSALTVLAISSCPQRSFTVGKGAGWIDSLSVYGHIYRLDIFNRSSWHGIHHSFCNMLVGWRTTEQFSHLSCFIQKSLCRSVFKVIMSRSLNVSCKYNC